MIVVEKVSPHDWKSVSHDAHRAVFGTLRDAESERISFALLALYNDKPAAYVTCQELDSETLYWQFGGVFPTVKGTVNAFRAYTGLLDYCFSDYQRVCFRVENKNFAMLKFALKLGFEIVGVRVFKNKILVEHVLERV